MMRLYSFRPNRSVSTRSGTLQRGFTLVELMIAITVTLVLVAGIVGMIVNLTRSFTAQDAMTQTQENERFAISVLDSTIRNSGYFPGAESFSTPGGVQFFTQASGQLNAFPATTVANPDGTTFAAGQVIVGTTVAGGSDTINVRVIAPSNGTITNCQGDLNKTASPIIWTSSISVNASNQLVCAVSVNGQTPGTPTVLADNISSMKLVYGVQSQMPNCLTAQQAPPLNVDAYVDASGLKGPQTAQLCWTLGSVTPLNWMYVQSVQATLTFVNTVVQTTGSPTVTLKPIVHTIYMMNMT